MNPKIDKFYQGEWNHDSSLGVGLRLSGFPNNICAFLDLLHEQSCNPVAARRILDELKENGEKLTTLMFALNFNYIGTELQKLGVKMEIIEPVASDKVNNGVTDQMAFDFVTNKNEPKFQDENQKLEVLKKANQFSISVEKLLHNFGPYDKNQEIAENAINNYKNKI